MWRRSYRRTSSPRKCFANSTDGYLIISSDQIEVESRCSWFLRGPFPSTCSDSFLCLTLSLAAVYQSQALMIGTSGINVANCYKQYGGTVDALKVHRLLLGCQWLRLSFVLSGPSLFNHFKNLKYTATHDTPSVPVGALYSTTLLAAASSSLPTTTPTPHT